MVQWLGVNHANARVRVRVEWFCRPQIIGHLSVDVALAAPNPAWHLRSTLVPHQAKKKKFSCVGLGGSTLAHCMLTLSAAVDVA